MEALQQQPEPEPLLTAHLAVWAQDVTEHRPGLLSSARCPVLSGLILCDPRKSRGCDGGEPGAQPLLFPSLGTGHLVPLHLCFLM